MENYENLAQELVKHLRGRRSQAQLSRRLGYESNVVNGWEHGRRYPTASEFLRLAARVGVDLERGLHTFRRNPKTPADLSPQGVATFLEELRSGVPINEVATKMGRSRFVVSRWLSGKTRPRLPDFLHLIDVLTLRLVDFVALFAPPEKLATTASAFQKLSARRRISRTMPWAQAVLHALELDAYAALVEHEPGWIAARTGLTLDQETAALEALHESGQIAFTGGRWTPATVDVVDTRPDPEAGRRMRQWCADAARTQLAHSRGIADTSGSLFSYNLFTVSGEDLERLRQLHLEYFRKLRAIVGSTDRQERLVVANVQLFDLGIPPQ